MRHPRWFVGSILLLALGACGKSPKVGPRAAQMIDMSNLRTFVGLVVVAEKPPMTDGVLDVYAFVRQRDITRENYSIFRSVRAGTGPTDAEIERGDYTNFPWERRRGEWKPDELVPLLWEKRPDAEGCVLVGLSDGSVQTWDKETLEKALK